MVRIWHQSPGSDPFASIARITHRNDLCDVYSHFRDADEKRKGAWLLLSRSGACFGVIASALWFWRRLYLSERQCFTICLFADAYGNRAFAEKLQDTRKNKADPEKERRSYVKRYIRYFF